MQIRKTQENAFTLVELIIVIIIIGVLVSLSVTQYNDIVEKGRIVEAKMRLGNMRQLAYEYYLTNGSLEGIQVSDLGVVPGCTSSSFYSYTIGGPGVGLIYLIAERCTSNGKMPDATRYYRVYFPFTSGEGEAQFCCRWDNADGPACFGMPR